MTALDEVAEHGISPPYRLAWTAVWLAFLAYPIGDILSGHHSTTWLVAAWISLAVFVVLYLRTMWLAVGTDLRGPITPPLAWLVALIVATCAMVVGFGSAWGGLLIYLGVATGLSLSGRAALITLAGVAAFSIADGVASGVSSSDLAFVAFLTTALGVSMLGLRRMFQLIVDLRAARDEVARLTAADQQARFARDLHDVLGHNLSVIALKSQVARRTIDREPSTAVTAVTDIETVARQSLRDVRELVAGYRQRSLADELAVADELLATAGIQPVIQRPPEMPDGAPGELLAWALREGTTNVIRHSHAAHCRITVTVDERHASLQIEDDGQARSPNINGSGLRGLQERISEAGGTVEAGPIDSGGFRLAVNLPR
jgi:two-component system sensor histidine kinase DesK